MHSPLRPSLLTTPDDWQAVFALLDLALDLDLGLNPAAHADWLAALEPEQVRHAALLAQLLGAHAALATDDFMRTPASALLTREPTGTGAAPAPPGLAPGGLVGPNGCCVRSAKAAWPPYGSPRARTACSTGRWR